MKNIKKIILALFCVFATITLASCGDKTIDFVNDLKLKTSYEGKEFVNDGIGEVTLLQNVDGDTAWFVSGGVDIKIRFVSVDTPESTGQIEPWGKAASKFTANILDNAKRIVLESHDGKAATLDSTGTRYLAFIWYSMDETSELRNLNLELVQEGFSTSKVTEGSKYQTEFNNAASQALSKKLHVYSSDPDPDYDDTNGEELTIKAVYENAATYLGRRVNFEAYVTRLDGNYAYVENEVEGVRYGLLVYLGYEATLKQCFRVGYKLRVHGFVQEYNGMYQISGCYYNMFEQGKPLDSETYAKCVRVLDKKAEWTPTTITALQLNSGEIKTRTLVTIENIKVTKIYSNSSIEGDTMARQMTLTCSSGAETVQIRVSEIYVNGNAIGESYFKNKSIQSLTGIVDIYNGTYQIRLVSIEDCKF